MLQTLFVLQMILSVGTVGKVLEIIKHYTLIWSDNDTRC